MHTKNVTFCLTQSPLTAWNLTIPLKSRDMNEQNNASICLTQSPLTAWNLTWMQTDFFLSATVPDMKVRRMLPTRLREVDPSMPATDPLTMPPTDPFSVPNSAATPGLQPPPDTTQI